jgi:uncharacterized delta-60 repeat protein
MFAGAAVARPGDLDPFFNPTGAGSPPGMVFSPPLSAMVIHKIALLPQGKIFAGTSVFNQRMLIGWLPDGSLDPAFGNSGIALPAAEDPGVMMGIAVQPDGKVLVACDGIDGAVLRFLPNGSLDQSFGSGGKVIINFPDHSGEVYTLVMLSDGGILVGGAVLEGVWMRPRLWKFLPDGRRDQTFGTAGGITLIDPGYISEMAEQPDGKIVATGAGPVGEHAWVGRLNARGTLDSTFGGSGRFALSHPVDAQGRSTRLALQSDGKVVIAGSFDAGSGDYAFFVNRFNPDGTHDTGFNGSGWVTANITAGPDFCGGLSLQADGKVLVAATSLRESAILARYLTNGTLDTGFGDNGVAKFPILTKNGIVSEVRAQPDGRILLGINAFDSQTNRNGLLLMRVSGTSLPETLSGEWPAGTPLHSGGTVNLGTAPRGDPLATETTVTLRNTGPVSLTNLSAAIGGPGASHFTLLAPLPSILNSGESTNLKVGYLALSEVSGFAASLTIETGDPAIEDFLIVLRGETQSPVATLTVLEGGVVITDYPAVDFGPALATHPATKTFTVKNSGNISLLIQGISLGTGGTPGDFTAGAPGTNELAPGAAATFPITFTPGGPGARSARLRIASTDTFNLPYETTLTGRLAAGMDAWRLTHFGTLLNEGDAADLADPDHDGVVNLMEYATFTNPSAPGPPPGEVILNGNTLEYTCLRPVEAPEHVAYTVEVSESVQGPWEGIISPLWVLSDDGVQQRIKFAIVANRLRGFLRLRVDRK